MKTLYCILYCIYCSVGIIYCIVYNIQYIITWYKIVLNGKGQLPLDPFSAFSQTNNLLYLVVDMFYTVFVVVVVECYSKLIHVNIKTHYICICIYRNKNITQSIPFFFLYITPLQIYLYYNIWLVFVFLSFSGF